MVSGAAMYRLFFVLAVLTGPFSPAGAEGCASLVKSMCPGASEAGTAGPEASGRRTLKVEVRPPAYAIGDRFPVEEHSLLMNPTRYDLPGSDGTWRYYAVDGVVYKVDTNSAQIIEVISDRRTWGLR
jgi:hypothetical protein